MTVLELMERTGIRNSEQAFTYIKDGLLEIQMQANEQMKRYTFDVEDGVQFYSLPSDMVTLEGVYRKYDSDAEKYVRIPRISNIDILMDADSSTAVSDDDIIVL